MLEILREKHFVHTPASLVQVVRWHSWRYHTALNASSACHSANKLWINCDESCSSLPRFMASFPGLHLQIVRRIILVPTLQVEWCCYTVSSLVPRPHLRERVWWHPADSSGFINVDYFLEKTQSAVQHQKSLAASARWFSTLWHVN